MIPMPWLLRTRQQLGFLSVPLPETQAIPITSTAAQLRPAALLASRLASIINPGSFPIQMSQATHLPQLPGSKFPSIKGSASSPIPAAGITGNVVYAVPPDARWQRGPPLSNAAQVTGNIVLIDRGASDVYG